MTSRWRTTRWISGLALLLMLTAHGAFTSKAESAELPVPAREVAQPTRQMHKVCVGTDGSSFRWDSANAPFASNCHMEDDKQAAPPEPQPAPK